MTSLMFVLNGVSQPMSTKRSYLLRSIFPAVEVGDLRLSVSDYMASRRTAGLLILKAGEIALERYGMGSGPESHRTSYSAAKSMTSTLVGAALHDGAIGSLDDRCDLYLPRLGI
jgi:CubicO group peptidase (beta-lactamase class C family)